MSDDNFSGKDSLGEAANRYVTFQIVSSVIGGIVFLILVFAVIIPAFNRGSQTSTFSGPGGAMPPMGIAGPGSETVTVNGRPATPQEKAMIDQQINKTNARQTGP